VKLKASELYELIQNVKNENKRYIFLRGSTRSGKTYAATQDVIVECLLNKITLTIARSTQVSLKSTILQDFKSILESLEIFKDENLNKSELIYKFENGSIVRFIGLDDSTGKLRGLKSDIVLVDEINTIEKSQFVQLDIRTSKYLICCYNPEIPQDWWGLDYENKTNGIMIHSTWNQNPFLDEPTIQAIKDLKDVDYDLYQIYNLGLIVEPKEKIFTQPQTYDVLPNTIKSKYFGIDWGFSNDEFAMVEVNVDGKNLYIKQLIYELGLTNEDIIYKIRELGLDRSVNIVADSAEPKSIAELKRYGLNIRPVNKSSILYAIQKMKQFQIYIHQDSVDLINEFSNYKFKKDRIGNITNATTGKDHLIDATKYVIIQFLDNKQKLLII
jgi:phage terminase large subunit